MVLRRKHHCKKKHRNDAHLACRKPGGTTQVRQVESSRQAARHLARRNHHTPYHAEKIGKQVLVPVHVNEGHLEHEIHVRPCPEHATDEERHQRSVEICQTACPCVYHRRWRFLASHASIFGRDSVLTTCSRVSQPLRAEFIPART